MNFVFGIFTLNGELNFSVQSDTAITQDPERIQQLFLTSLENIQHLTLGTSAVTVPQQRSDSEPLVSMSQEAGGPEAAEAAEEFAERLDEFADTAAAVAGPLDEAADAITDPLDDAAASVGEIVSRLVSREGNESSA
jgi:hypothetical protein